MNGARKAGAYGWRSGLARLVCVLLLSMAGGPANAADVHLLDVDAGVVRASPAAGVGDALAAGPLRLEIGTRTGTAVLELAPHRVLGAFGVAEGEAEAYAGTVPGRPGSWAALTRTRRGWSGIWFDGEEYYGIEAATALADTGHQALAGAPPGQPMVFRLSDVVWDDVSFEGDVLHAPPGNGQELVTGLTPTALTFDDGPTHRLAVAMVADHFLAAREGEFLESHLLAQLNIIDGLYRNQLGLEVTSASITTFTRREEDPLSGTTDASRLLDQLSAWRAGNVAQRQSALTHLFTGRDIDRRTVGLAYLDKLCSRRYSASLSEARTAPTFAALIAAHEIAHVIGAPHDGDEEGACADVSSNSFLMGPRINGSQQFSACSIAQMMPRIEAASCLTPPVDVGGGAPVDVGGGGGALAGTALALLGLMALYRARCRTFQMRANQSAR
jgi:hypothetical protein